MLKHAWIIAALAAILIVASCGGGGGGGGTTGDAEVGMAEEIYGSFTFDGVQFRWIVQGDMVQVNILNGNTQYFQTTLAPVYPKAIFDFSFYTGHAHGMLVLNPKTATSNGSLEAKNLTVTQSGQTRTFTGIMGTW